MALIVDDLTVTADQAKYLIQNSADPVALAETLCEMFDIDVDDLNREICDDGCWSDHRECAIIQAVRLLMAMETLI